MTALSPSRARARGLAANESLSALPLPPAPRAPGARAECEPRCAAAKAGARPHRLGCTLLPPRKARPAASNPRAEPGLESGCSGLKAVEDILLLATQGPPCLTLPGGLRVGTEDREPKPTRRGKAAQTVGRVAPRRQFGLRASARAQALQGGGRGGPAPLQPRSFLHCDWKPEHRLPLPSARSIPFKDKGSSMHMPSSSPKRQVTFWWRRRPRSPPARPQSEAALCRKPSFASSRLPRSRFIQIEIKFNFAFLVGFRITTVPS